jgi:hypothetical protein
VGQNGARVVAALRPGLSGKFRWNKEGIQIPAEGTAHDAESPGIDPVEGGGVELIQTNGYQPTKPVVASNKRAGLSAGPARCQGYIDSIAQVAEVRVERLSERKLCSSRSNGGGSGRGAGC